MDIRINPNISDEVIIGIEDAVNLLECKLIALTLTKDNDSDWDYSQSILEVKKDLAYLKTKI